MARRPSPLFVQSAMRCVLFSLILAAAVGAAPVAVTAAADNPVPAAARCEPVLAGALTPVDALVTAHTGIQGELASDRSGCAEWLDYLEPRGLLQLTSRREVLSNAPVLIAPRDTRCNYTLLRARRLRSPGSQGTFREGSANAELSARTPLEQPLC
jgi:hypothetical protein